MVDSLAAVLVRLQHVTISTGTEVRAFGVGALLGTETGWKALVQILASESIFSKFLARRANTNRTEWSFLTAVGTLTILVLTFSEIAAFSFISAIGTISDVITHRRHVDTTSGDFWALPLTSRATERRRHTSMFMRFVGIVAAIVFAITNVSLENAF